MIVDLLYEAQFAFRPSVLFPELIDQTPSPTHQRPESLKNYPVRLFSIFPEVAIPPTQGQYSFERFQEGVRSDSLAEVNSPDVFSLDHLAIEFLKFKTAPGILFLTRAAGAY